MAKSLSVASVIDKNKLTGGAVWVVLLDIALVDPNTRTVVETLYVARNTEDVEFGGFTYKAGNFDINIDQRQNQAPSVSISAQDQSGYLDQKLDEMAGGVFSNVTLKVVNTDRLDKPAEMEEFFQIVRASSKNFVVNIELGAENPLAISFPKHTQRKDRCAWRYRGYGCGYTGSMPACDYTKDGAIGCVAHGNLANFRALSGMVQMNI